MLGDMEIVRTFVANTAYEALRDYVFAVIPLFMLMGDFLAKCGAARDLYALAHRFSRWLPAQLAVATIVSNALFAFVTGVSIAAAAAFSRIAYPEMMRYGYRRDFALGCMAGSACLGMLIPPSVLMIVWAVLTEMSIGKLFLAGVIPGLLTAGGMIAYVVIAAIVKPELAGRRYVARAAPLGADVASPAAARRAAGHRDRGAARPRAGQHRPGGSAGARRAVGDLVRHLHADRGRRRRRGRRADPGADQGHHAARSLAGDPVGRPHLGPLLLLLFCAQLYSRVLSMTGFTEAAKTFLVGSGHGPLGRHGADGRDLVRARLPDQLDLDHPADGADLRADRRRRSASIRSPSRSSASWRSSAACSRRRSACWCSRCGRRLPMPTVPLSEIFYGSIPYWVVLLLVVVGNRVLPADRDVPAGSRCREVGLALLRNRPHALSPGMTAETFHQVCLRWVRFAGRADGGIERGGRGAAARGSQGRLTCALGPGSAAHR